jgi:myo-inositol 2-dehydrogenase / D-chiro-inositol 1-dehydrogenase
VNALRVAVVGAGRMGRVHLDALSLTDRVVAAAVVDPDPAARAVTAVPQFAGAAHRRATHAGPSPATFGSVDDLLAAGACDAALIAAPTPLHLDLVRRFAAAGVPVLCEKPCGLTADDAAAAAAAAEEAGIVLQIGYWRRFVPELRALRDRLPSLGSPSLVICHQWDEDPPAPGFRAHSGGIAIDMAVHEIDQARWLLGQEFGDVSAAGTTDDDPDTAVAVGRLSGGALAALTLGCRFPAGDSCWLELFATGGYERVEFMSGANAQQAFLSALAAQAEAFADAVGGGERTGAGGDDAVAALRVAERIGAALRRPAVLP